MFKLISWDGSKVSFEDKSDAIAWIREHLSNWMEEDDFLKSWEATGRSPGIVYGVYTTYHGRTDAFVHMSETLSGDVTGGCCECQRALDLSTSRIDDRHIRFGVTLDWLWCAECVNDECQATTKIMQSLDAKRWPHRAYKPCEVDGCIRTGIYRICMECMSKLDGKVRGNVAIGRPGAVEQAVAMLPKRRFISTED